MEWQGGNAQLLAMASELHPWRFELEIFPSRLPVDMYLSPNWMLSRVRSVKHFFFFGGVLVPTSLWLGPINALPFATVVFWLHFFSFFKKENHGEKIPLSTFHCNQLQHTCSARFKTDLPDYFRFNFVQVLTEPCGSVVLSWCHGSHMTVTSCSKYRVCFHSNQYFYVPQENVNLSNEQCVC